jgi:putative transposase
MVMGLKWPRLRRLGTRRLLIGSGSPWEDGYNERFKDRLRDGPPARKIFHSLREAEALIERWRRRCNTVRPHSAPGYWPPAPEAVLPWPSGPTCAALRQSDRVQVTALPGVGDRGCGSRRRNL